MKFEDSSQNLKVRILAVQLVAVALLAVLGARLYFLQIVRGEHFAERARQQRVRRIPLPAPRGAILDRRGRILADSRSVYNIVLARDALKNMNGDFLRQSLVTGLKVDGEMLDERLRQMTQPEYEQMIVKENADLSDIAWVEAHSQELPELRVEAHPQRVYPLGKTLAHVLGYTGEISKELLAKPEFVTRGLKSGDRIGREGLEATYDEILRGRDGWREIVVDSRSRFQYELKIVPPQPGQDLITTIDLDLQLAAERELENSATKSGVVIAQNPNNGEILALASAPSFDPNVFTAAGTSKEARRQIAALYDDPHKPLLNRATRGRYYPGSTWKIPESIAALRQGAIRVGDSKIMCGGGLQTGNRFTRDTSGNHGSIDLPTAITHSCDGYYYRLALRMKPEGIIKMVEDFEYDKPTGVDLPNEITSRTPKYFKPLKEQTGKWNDIDTVFASIGQVSVEVTPMAMLRAVSSVGVGGRMFVPHVFSEAKTVEAAGEAETDGFRPPRQFVSYAAQPPKIIEMTAEENEYVLRGMSGVVNGGGTARAIKIDGFEIAGKTGTAQVVAVGKDVGANRDHAWFVSFAPAHKPEIAVIALIENSGFGGKNAAPAARALYDVYLSQRQSSP